MGSRSLAGQEREVGGYRADSSGLGNSAQKPVRTEFYEDALLMCRQ